MAVIPVLHAQANFIFTGQSAPTGAQVTLGLNIENMPGTLDDLAFSLATLWSDNIMGQQTAQITLSEVLVKAGPNDTGPSASVAVDLDGIVSGESEVPNVSVLVQKLTGFGGRTGRGRMYIPGVNGGLFVSDGLMESSNLTAWQEAMEDFRLALNGYGTPPVLLHGPNSPVSTPMPIVGFNVSARAATQRQRLRR